MGALERWEARSSPGTDRPMACRIPARTKRHDEPPSRRKTSHPQGKPHWGKNSDRTYMHPRCPVRDNARDFAGLLAVRDRHDPDRVFEPPLMAAVAARAAAPLYPRCALDRACYW